MTAKIMISVSDDLKTMIDEYNRTHMFKKLHISEICQQAIYDVISKDTPNAEQIKKNLIDNIIEEQKQPKQQEILEYTDKPTIPCPNCGTMFVKKVHNKRFCSENCKSQYRTKRIRKQEK